MNMVPSLTYHQYIQKLRDVWDSQICILRGTHPAATHKVMV